VFEALVIPEDVLNPYEELEELDEI